VELVRESRIRFPIAVHFTISVSGLLLSTT
jgi:hypothetical protein